MNKLLLIVDPQVDFINGSLPVPGAEEAMDKLAGYILAQDGTYRRKVVTLDWHPYRHISFVENGGEWPTHCVQYTHGASIWSALIAPLNTTAGELTILHKGTDPDTEEYSIFKNPESATKLKDIIAKHQIDQIDLCGLAGDICVLNTLKDGLKLYPSLRFNVLCSYSPSLDGGEALDNMIKSL